MKSMSIGLFNVLAFLIYSFASASNKDVNLDSQAFIIAVNHEKKIEKGIVLIDSANVDAINILFDEMTTHTLMLMGVNWTIHYVENNRPIRAFDVRRKHEDPKKIASLMKLLGIGEKYQVYTLKGNKKMFVYFDHINMFRGGRLLFLDEYDYYPRVYVDFEVIDSLLMTCGSEEDKLIRNYPIGYIPKKVWLLRNYISYNFPSYIRINERIHQATKQNRISEGVYRRRGRIEAIFPMNFTCNNFKSKKVNIYCERPDTIEIKYLHKEFNIKKVSGFFKDIPGFYEITK